MISFKCDYSEGAHPQVLKYLMDTNLEQSDGYGDDRYCKSAREKIQGRLGNTDADVYFLSGGTQTNLCLISHVLRPYEGVISADTGHIATHESGAIEATGHKVIEMPHRFGKLTPDMVRQAVTVHDMPPHMVHPKMVYISHPTELGTLYTREEMRELADLCRENNLFFYIDGARLAAALCCGDDYPTMAEIAAMCDAFYVGGTKCGALFGEALVIPNKEIAKNFGYTLKQHGALLAKGRMLGIQFDALFEGELYEEIGKYANDMAAALRHELMDLGFPVWLDSPTNQQFFVLPNTVIAGLEKSFGLTLWEPYDEESTVVRFVTSWATQPEDIEQLITAIRVLI